ncbi:hypothetical protein PPL_05056 [Heterostelium album PN500]|uniref:Ankyrin repeat protein n=1 Tax=Heterostelium pallidum (strain ATCC 26659 / Pp 5 / PN500) TaxID=670386 RepID=D3B9B2_HETP5|nr:hypothetical protein PPL_05056 [Heterostelium album PN500]EFA81824.1 hypothetical protein PPL_05056 [Heterostelium album PN500]|eukprot:XP_020433941.1 hypothetical protein PPL_05056 [Heterostelium album PN500]
MDKKIFTLVFNNTVLNTLIFNHVVSISSMNNSREHYKWDRVLNQPAVLASHGYVDQLKEYLNDAARTINLNGGFPIFQSAIRGGDLKTLEFLLVRLQIERRTAVEATHGEEYGFLNTLLTCCSMYGKLHLIKYLLDRFPNHQWNYKRPFVSSPYSSDMEIVKFFAAKLDEYPDQLLSEKNGNVFNVAAVKGDIPMIQWLIENRSEDLDSSDMFFSGVNGNHLHILKYVLLEHSSLFDPTSTKYISSSLNDPSRFEIFKFVFGLGCACPSNIMDMALQANNLEAMKWLHSNTLYRCAYNSIDVAARSGRLDIVLWLNENCTTKPTFEAMNGAAAAGHLHIVRWLHENRTEGCSVEAINRAAINGHLETVKWLYENRTEGYSPSVFETVPMVRNVELLEWFEQSMGDPQSDRILFNAALFGTAKSVEFLHQKNKVNNRFGFSKKIMDAASSNSLEIVQFLHENRTEGCTEEASLHAFNNGKIDTLEWLLANRTECTIKSIERDIINKIERFTPLKYSSLEWALKNISIPVDKLVLYLWEIKIKLPWFFEIHDLLADYISKNK